MKTPPTESFFFKWPDQVYRDWRGQVFFMALEQECGGKRFRHTSISFLPTTQLEHRAAGL